MRRSLISSRHHSRQGGYTLVEMAISLLVIGVIVGTAIPIYQHYRDRTQKDQNVVKQTLIDFSLEAFKNKRGRYPCPAPLNAEPGTPGYGKETNCSPMTIAPGTCINGLCHEISPRTIAIDTTDASGNLVTTNVQPRVIRGALPFKTLGLTEEQSIDEYGGRFSYAVTQLLTDKKTFRVERGGIDVIDGNEPTPNSLVEPEGSALYYVFSHGPDNIGAYSLYGVEIAPCNGPMYDNENCNTSPAHKEATYRHTMQSTKPVLDITAGVALPGAPGGPLVNNETHFDDTADYVGLGRRPIWETGEDTNREPTSTINNTDSVDDKVVVSGKDITLDEDTDEDHKDLFLIVRDQMKLSDGPKKFVESAGGPGVGEGAPVVNKICGNGGYGQHCMETAVLGADDASDPRRLHCPSYVTNKDLAPTGVSFNRINCQLPEVNCDEPGELLKGVDTDGKPICETYTKPVFCGAADQTICGVKQTLPANSAIGTVVTLTGGTSYSRPFTCTKSTSDPTKGVWVAGSASGSCTCTPSVVTQTKSCAAGYTGGITQVVTTTCPSGKKTTLVTANTCTCTGAIQTQDINCPAGFTGKIKQSRTLACPSGKWGNWGNISNTCACRPPYDQDKACPAGYNTGKITEECSYSCDMSNLTSSGPTCTQKTNTCACTPGTFVTKEPCPVGFDGDVTVTTKVACPNAVKTVTKVPNCSPIVSSCTMTVTDNNSLGNASTTWREGQSCTYDTVTNNCKDVKFCYRTLGTNMYSLHRCSCQ